jgi:outer membrane lipoprotein-sorting protein
MEVLKKVMLLKKFFLLLILSLIFLCSCEKKDDLYNAHKKLAEMKSYIAIADITVNSNKGTSNYKVKQYFVEPDKLRIETTEPDFLKGKVICFDGAKWKIYHPLIKQSFEADKLKNEDELVFLGILKNGILSGEDAKYKYASKDGVDYVQIKTTIPGGNDYRKYTIVYLNRKTYLPEIMEIYDENDQVRVIVKYSEFKYNEEIKSSLFNLE